MRSVGRVIGPSANSHRIGPIVFTVVYFASLAAGFHQYVPRIEHDDCPVHVHSLRAGGAAAFHVSDDVEPDDGEPLANGNRVRPTWPNNTGQLASEDFRPNEFAKSKCQFIFLGADDEHVQIIFHRFSLLVNAAEADESRATNKSGSALPSANELRCEDEYHVTAHVLVGPRMSKIHDFCGDELPPQLMSTMNLLTLSYVIRAERHLIDRLQDENNKTAPGFLLEYRFLTDYGRQPSEAIPIAGTNCSFMFNGSLQTSGDLWSPNYPGFYPRNLDCQYVFHGQDEQIVLITFEYFDVEGFGQCEERTQSDFVLFSNYKTMDRTNRRYCGGTQPPKSAIASESNYFRMQFRTNDIFDGTGFYAHYQFYNKQLSQQSRIRLTTSAASRKEPMSLIILLLILLPIMLYVISYK